MEIERVKSDVRGLKTDAVSDAGTQQSLPAAPVRAAFGILPVSLLDIFLP